MSNHCPGLHCDGCKGGGGGGWLLVPLLVVGAVIWFVHRYWRVIVETVQIATWMVLSLAGAAILVAIVVVAARAYQAQPRQVSYRSMRRRRSAPIKIIRLGTEATPQHRALREHMNDDLARQAAHLTDDPVFDPREKIQ